MNNEKAIQEYKNKRFGMFIHWGVYSLLGGEWGGRVIPDDEIGEWIMNLLQIPVSEYEKIAAAFKPHGFDADALVKLAFRAGMRYLVFTSKHHDGFAMFKSEADKYNIYDWAGFKRDIVAELAVACEKYGVKLGLYYSQSLDWHEEHAGGWDVAPYGQRPTWANIWDYPDNRSKDYNIYYEKKVVPQVKELLTNYGNIFLMWFDTPRNMSLEQSNGLYKLVKSLQPGCIVNSRIGNGVGDYTTLGDNQIPVCTLDKPNEALVTLNDTWGYKRNDNNWKTPGEIIETLAKVVSRNVNLLLNVGPMGDGRLTAETIKILNDIAGWTAVNGEAIHGAAGNPAPYDFDFAYVTANANKLYFCMKNNSAYSVELNGFKSKLKDAYKLIGHAQVPFTADNGPDINKLTVDFPETDKFMPVYALEFNEAPKFDSRIIQQNDVLSLLPISSAVYDGALKTAKSVLIENPYTDSSGLGKIKIGRGGILNGWSRRTEYMEWDAYFTKPGKYKTEVIIDLSDMPDDVRERLCLYSVKIDVSGAAPITSNFTESYKYTDSRTVKHNARSVIDFGTVQINTTGGHKIKISLTEDLDDVIESVSLTGVKFCLLDENQ